jgi:hypothetical protein
VHVRVAPRPERVGQLLDVAQHALELAPGEARREDLEHARSRRDATRMSCTRFDVAGVEHPLGAVEQLARAHAHDAPRRVPERLRW